MLVRALEIVTIAANATPTPHPADAQFDICLGIGLIIGVIVFAILVGKGLVEHDPDEPWGN
jgi:hypothetical protein